MRKFFDSGGAFMLVALFCFTAGVVSESGAIFIAVGGFWLIMAMVVRAKKAKEPPPGEGSI